MEMELAILNTTIVTTDGNFSISTITTEVARRIVRINPVASYIGHLDTVTLLSRILGVELGYSREMFSQKVGQKALCFKLNSRLDAGRAAGGELTEAELEDIGFTFKLLVRTK